MRRTEISFVRVLSIVQGDGSISVATSEIVLRSLIRRADGNICRFGRENEDKSSDLKSLVSRAVLVRAH